MLPTPRATPEPAIGKSPLIRPIGAWRTPSAHSSPQQRTEPQRQYARRSKTLAEALSAERARHLRNTLARQAVVAFPIADPKLPIGEPVPLFPRQQAVARRVAADPAVLLRIIRGELIRDDEDPLAVMTAIDGSTDVSDPVLERLVHDIGEIGIAGGSTEDDSDTDSNVNSSARCTAAVRA